MGRARTGALAAAVLLFAAPAAADSLLDRLELDPAARTALERACGADRICMARRLAAAMPDRFRLLTVRHPTSDEIRWVETQPSLGTMEELDDGRLRVEVLRFGRELLREWRRRVPEGRRLVLDLRRHPGGDLDRMLKLAASLLGEGMARVRLRAPGTERELAGRAGARGNWPVDAVLVGPQTASSAEVFAALLWRAGARLCGSRTQGKDRVAVILPVSHDLRLEARAGRLTVADASLAGGLRPEAPAAACLADGSG